MNILTWFRLRRDAKLAAQAQEQQAAAEAEARLQVVVARFYAACEKALEEAREKARIECLALDNWQRWAADYQSAYDLMGPIHSELYGRYGTQEARCIWRAMYYIREEQDKLFKRYYAVGEDRTDLKIVA